MIPTRFRSKLPQNLSYPIGAEAVSAGLVGAPHLGALELAFYGRPFGPASRFQRVLAERLPYTIVSAGYLPARKPGLSAAGFMIESGWYNEHWELTVYPVLRVTRHAANRLLIEQGLPTLAGWLRGAESTARGITIQRVELVFNPCPYPLLTSERPGSNGLFPVPVI